MYQVVTRTPQRKKLDYIDYTTAPVALAQAFLPTDLGLGLILVIGVGQSTLATAVSQS